LKVVGEIGVVENASEYYLKRIKKNKKARVTPRNFLIYKSSMSSLAIVLLLGITISFNIL
jgi:hypothetical protein